MALKASESFIRYVTMGAASAHRAIELLRARGHDVRELERYSTCNKIWQTKIKRLRMPDLFCLRCGQRFEIRAKTNLEIKMSDSPTVPGREWDAGMRDEDVVIFVRCDGDLDPPVPAGHIVGFDVGSMRASVAASRLGPPKSAGEGAERDRKWPAIVPSSSGTITAIDAERITLALDSGRRQTLRLARRDGVTLTAYASVGQRVEGDVQFLAGAPSRTAVLDCAGVTWDPVRELERPDAMDRFAAVKASGLRLLREAIPSLATLAQSDPDPRLRLEAVGALMRLGNEGANDSLLTRFDSPEREDLRMEAVLLAGEVRNMPAREALLAMLARPFVAREDELRAAVVWTLGSYGQDSCEHVIPYLRDRSDLVAAHAAVAMGTRLTPSVRSTLISLLAGPDLRAAASAAWVLTRDTVDSIAPLLELAERDPIARGWVVAILGRRPPEEVEPSLESHPDMLRLVSPWWIVTPSRNWSAAPAGAQMLDELSRQIVAQTV